MRKILTEMVKERSYQFKGEQDGTFLHEVIVNMVWIAEESYRFQSEQLISES